MLVGLAIIVAAYAVGSAAGAIVSLGVAGFFRDPWAAAGSPVALAAGMAAVTLLRWAAEMKYLLRSRNSAGRAGGSQPL
jgi:hypothetical protein